MMPLPQPRKADRSDRIASEKVRIHGQGSFEPDLGGSRAEVSSKERSRSTQAAASLLPIPKRASVIPESEHALQAAILNGSLSGFLPPERELCDQLAISRSSLRVVLKNLAASGWIRIEHGRRTSIIREPGRRLLEAAPRKQRNVVLLHPHSHFILDASVLWIDELRRLLYLLGYILVAEQTVKFRGDRMNCWLDDIDTKYRPALWILLSCPEQVSVRIAKTRHPAIVAGMPHPGSNFPSICVDYYAACRHAVGYLMSLGHRRIGMVAPQTLLPGDKRSLLGFQDGLEAHREGDSKGVVLSYQSSAASIYNVLRREFTQRDHATALIVCRPAAAIGVISSLATLRICVPDDVSIICRDYSPSVFAATWPPLCHYFCDPTKIARKFVSTFLKIASGSPLQKVHSHVVPQFSKGDSVRPVDSTVSPSC